MVIICGTNLEKIMKSNKFKNCYSFRSLGRATAFSRLGVIAFSVNKIMRTKTYLVTFIAVIFSFNAYSQTTDTDFQIGDLLEDFRHFDADKGELICL